MLLTLGATIMLPTTKHGDILTISKIGASPDIPLGYAGLPPIADRGAVRWAGPVFLRLAGAACVRAALLFDAWSL